MRDEQAQRIEAELLDDYAKLLETESPLAGLQLTQNETVVGSLLSRPAFFDPDAEEICIVFDPRRGDYPQSAIEVSYGVDLLCKRISSLIRNVAESGACLSIPAPLCDGLNKFGLRKDDDDEMDQAFRKFYAKCSKLDLVEPIADSDTVYRVGIASLNHMRFLETP